MFRMDSDTPRASYSGWARNNPYSYPWPRSSCQFPLLLGPFGPGHLFRQAVFLSWQSPAKSRNGAGDCLRAGPCGYHSSAGDRQFFPLDRHSAIRSFLVIALARRMKDLVAEYGQVIVDECHHLSGFTFGQVLKEVKARHVVGLTAHANPQVFPISTPSTKTGASRQRPARTRPITTHCPLPRFGLSWEPCLATTF